MKHMSVFSINNKLMKIRSLPLNFWLSTKFKLFCTIGTLLMVIIILLLLISSYCKCFQNKKGYVCKYTRPHSPPPNSTHINLETILPPLPNNPDHILTEIIKEILKTCGEDAKLQMYNWPNTPYLFFSFIYITFPYSLQPASPGLVNQEHVLAPTIPLLIFWMVQMSTSGHTRWFFLQTYHYKGLAYLQNGFINHNLHVFCWTSLQYQKQLLQHITLDCCITPPKRYHHDLTKLTSRFRPWWCIHSSSSRRNPTTNLQHQKHTYNVNKISKCHPVMVLHCVRRLQITPK